MKIKLIIISAIFVCLGLSSCSNEVDFGEQYKKTLYIVNSRDMLYTREHYYGSDNNEMVFSIYCASTEPIKEDVSVQLTVDLFILDSLNRRSALGNPLYIEKMMLPSANYHLEEPMVTIKAGTQYATFKVPIDLTGLDADISYAFPLSIESNSEKYDVDRELRSIVYEIEMANGFSGDFLGSSIELGGAKEIIRSVQPTLKALSAYSVRMPIHTLSGDVTHLDTNFMVLDIDSDSTTVYIRPWKEAKVIDLGNNTYDRVTQTYLLNYQFTDKGGNTFTIRERIVNIDAEDIDEYE